MRTQAIAILNPRGQPARSGNPRRRVQARYEAAWPSPDRGYTWEQLWDTDSELAPRSYTLDQLQRISRYLWKNDPIVRGFIERVITYTVGCGINPIPASTDKAWSKAAKAAWVVNRKHIQYSRRCSWGKTLRQILRLLLVDGNVFIVLVESPVTGRARIQIVPAHRLKEIKYDAGGRATRYIFAEKSGRERSKSFEDVIHLANDLLPEGRMGEPILSAALRTAQDMGEILAFEKVAVKDSSRVKDVITTASGEIDPSELITNGGTDLAGADEAPLRYYRRVIGPETKVIREGDTYLPVEPKRPGPAWQGFMQFLAESMCIAGGFPPSFVLPTHATGPTVRENMSAVGRVTEQWQDDIQPAVERMFERTVETEAMLGSIPALPDDYRMVRWQVPIKPTIDAGRESQQRREDVMAALLSKQEYWGDTGQDSDEEEDQIIAEAVLRREKLAAAGLTLEEFQALLTLEVPKQVQVPQPQGDMPNPQEVAREARE